MNRLLHGNGRRRAPAPSPQAPTLELQALCLFRGRNPGPLGPVPTGQGSATSGTGPRIGFTIPRAVGKAVVRNRIRRRLREILRKRLDEIDPGMDLVINPRRKAYEAPLEDLRRDVERLVTRCRAL
jgi:ribonuclease P protein component